MPEISKPTDLSTIWCSGGDLIKPASTKISTGWEVEIPPRQWFNWLDNRQDQFNAHVNQHGIPMWDSATEYQANKSLTMGSDGAIYKALSTNTNVDPVGDVSGTWEAFLVDTAEVVTTIEDQFTGTNSSGTATGFQRMPGSNIVMQWGTGTAGALNAEGPVVTFDEPFVTAVFAIVATHGPDSTEAVPVSTSSVTLTSFRLRTTNSIAVGVQWIAFGI